MSKIKDDLLNKKRFEEKEFFETNNAPYKFIDEKGEHLHTFENQPLIGTTAIGGVVSKNLTWWAAETSAVECLEVGEHIPTIREEYLKACTSGNKKKAIDELQKKYPIFKKARFAHFTDKNDKAKKGTDLHALLEDYVKDCIKTNNSKPLFPVIVTANWKYIKIKPFIEWAGNNVKRFLWSEGHCFSKRLWVGGISDLGYEKNDGTYGIMDFKSSKEAYLPQFWQCAGYDIQISESGVFDANGNKIFTLDKPITEYAVFPFGMPYPVPQFNIDTAGGRTAFEAMALLYKKLN